MKISKSDKCPVHQLKLRGRSSRNFRTSKKIPSILLDVEDDLQEKLKIPVEIFVGDLVDYHQSSSQLISKDTLLVQVRKKTCPVWLKIVV